MGPSPITWSAGMGALLLVQRGARGWGCFFLDVAFRLQEQRDGEGEIDGNLESRAVALAVAALVGGYASGRICRTGPKRIWAEGIQMGRRTSFPRKANGPQERGLVHLI